MLQWSFLFSPSYGLLLQTSCVCVCVCVYVWTKEDARSDTLRSDMQSALRNLVRGKNKNVFCSLKLSERVISGFCAAK